MRYVTFHTPQYADEARQLRATFDEHCKGDELHVFERPCTGRWERNCAMKSDVCYQAFTGGLAPFVWVDADARFHGRPAFFDDLEADFSCLHIPQTRHHGGRMELLSGTLFFGPGSGELLRVWVNECKEKPIRFDQKSLAVAFERLRDTLAFVPLPMALCCVPDLYQFEDCRPYTIEHTQASRRFKRMLRA